MRPICRTQSLGLLLAIVGWSTAVHAERPPDSKSGSVRQATHGSPTQAPAEAPDVMALIRSGWVQIVRFEAPIGATVEIASSSGAIAIETPSNVGLMLGQPYRLRISNIPDRPGITYYPTIRLLGYILPPAHVNPVEYPIPIQFLDRDLDDVNTGRMVSNVVFLEDPLNALPVAFPPGEMPVVDVRPGEDALFRASDLGRPMIYVQLGSRQPLNDQLESSNEDPTVYMIPQSEYHSGNDDDSMVRQAEWMYGTVPFGACPGRLPGHSAPLCANCTPICRQPYRTHPRMPWDECLPDGGDQIPYVHLNAYNQVTGLGASETVAQFTRPGERPRIVASNQVCLYAPRFGLVRSSSVSITGLHTNGPRFVDHQVRRAALLSKETPESRSQQDKARSVRRRELANTVAMNEPLAGIDELRVIAAMIRQQGIEKLSGRTAPSDVEQSDEARIARSIEAARTWKRDQFPAYTAITESGAQISGSALTGEIQQIKEVNRRPGELVLRKSVNPTTAKAGDVVEFTIEYFNVGQRPIENVSIIDSLTARLEYVPNSAGTDHRAIFTAGPNDVESAELRWDISDPIPGGGRGVVWFQAKVR